MAIITSNQQLRDVFKQHHPDENVLNLPVVKSVVVHVGVGSIRDDKDAIQKTVELLQNITGQKPTPTKAKKSIAAFKTRQGNVIGYKVTLRGKRAYDFINKLFHFSLPRIRDFRGLNEKIINRGTVNIGLKESNVLPEISENSLNFNSSLQATITLTTNDKIITREVVEALGAKFK